MMATQRYSSFVHWFSRGPFSPYVRMIKSPGGFLNLIETAMPAVEMSDPAVPELVLHCDLRGGFGVNADLGSGRFSSTTRPGDFFLAAANFGNTISVDSDHYIRSIAFPISYWSRMFEDAPTLASALDFRSLHRGAFSSSAIWSAQLQLWRLCDEEGMASRLLAQSAGCEILAELCRMSGSPLATARGGLAPSSKRRILELMRARLAEDVSLDEMAAEARLSPYHFARMFKKSVGMPPRVYLTRLRLERACELLEGTDLPVTEIAFEVGYSSNQVLARVFQKHRRMTPSDYRRKVRDPVRTLALNAPTASRARAVPEE